MSDWWFDIFYLHYIGIAANLVNTLFVPCQRVQLYVCGFGLSQNERVGLIWVRKKESHDSTHQSFDTLEAWILSLSLDKIQKHCVSSTVGGVFTFPYSSPSQLRTGVVVYVSPDILTADLTYPKMLRGGICS